MKTYRRYVTRLRFEAGQLVPAKGARWYTHTAFGNVSVRVTLLEVRRTFPHPTDPGVTLMDAKISRSEVRHEPGGGQRMTRFDAQRIEYILRRHGWTAYAYRDFGHWRVVCHWPGHEDEKWDRGIEDAWYTVSNLGQALHAISVHSAREKKGGAA